MDPSKEPDVCPYLDTKYPSEEEGTSSGQSRGPYAVVDRDHQPIDVSSPSIDDWTDIDVSSDDSILCSDVSELDINDTLEAQPTAQTAQDVSGLNALSGQIGATVFASNSEIDLNDDVSPDDSISCADISELDLNDALEAQPSAPTARDASDSDISSDQAQAKATPSVSDTSDLESEWKLLSAEIWETVHASSSDIPDPNDAAKAQPTAPTAHFASDRDSSSDRTQARTTSSLVSDISDLRDTLRPKSTANTARVVSDFGYLGEQILATATLLVIARRRLAAANSSASSIPSRSRWEAANRSAYNGSSSQRWATATTSASNIPSHSRWEAANRSAYNGSSSQRWATATTSASNIPSHSRWEAANRSAYNGSSSQRWATTTTSASDISSHQYKATATTSASNISSSQFWATATTSASNRSSSQRQRWATTTTSAPTRLAAPAPTHPFMESSTSTQRTWPTPLGSKSCSAESWAAPTGSTNRSTEHWPAPDPSKRESGAAYVPSTAVNDNPVLSFNPIWYTPSSIRHFKPLAVPPPTYENGGLPSTEPSSSENLVPDVAEDTFDPVQAVDPAAASRHVSPKIEPRRTIYDFVAAVRAYLRPFLNF
ncbi:hypothetical protein BBO_01178 [Beauveria brongniartii RCEF 3172]|uniref:Uncharacterized protein n=1 Tax=Beauveria brongniartii RCEF 3172 TaxID=1081107 RepID=A0A167K585_9HYPO|nr:hypothetical protein BBO_01178 [Beauveria brongniartii RCEF 3172]